MDTTNVTASIPSAESDPEPGLRRVVGLWGSFTRGYADVGAVVYVALGLVVAAAQGAANVAFRGATLVLISSNAGVFGASRITYSMGRYHLLPGWFNYIHPGFRTPVRILAVFSGFALLELWGAGFSKNVYDTLGKMYVFGATASYVLAFASLLRRRVKDPWTPRPDRVPLNVRIGACPGQAESIAIVGILGFLAISSILAMGVLTHAVGRVAGPTWIVFGLIIFWTYRQRSGLPLTGSTHRDWDVEQLQVYHDAGEIEIIEEFAASPERRNWRRAARPAGLNGAPAGTASGGRE